MSLLTSKVRLIVTNDKITKLVRSLWLADRFQTFVNPNRKLSQFVTDLTGIKDEH